MGVPIHVGGNGYRSKTTNRLREKHDAHKSQWCPPPGAWRAPLHDMDILASGAVTRNIGKHAHR